MPSAKKILRKLVAARDEQTLVRVSRSFKEQARHEGFVVAIGRKWILLVSTADGGHFDGYAALRIDDIKNVRPDTSYESRMSRLQPEWPPTPPAPSMDLDSTRGLIGGIAQDNVLVGIQLEGREPGVRIGTVDSMTKNRLWLLAIHPNATWDEIPEGCRIEAITAVYRGGRYYDGLQTISDLDRAAATTPGAT